MHMLYIYHLITHLTDHQPIVRCEVKVPSFLTGLWWGHNLLLPHWEPGLSVCPVSLLRQTGQALCPVCVRSSPPYNVQRLYHKQVFPEIGIEFGIVNVQSIQVNNGHRGATKTSLHYHIMPWSSASEWVTANRTPCLTSTSSHLECEEWNEAIRNPPCRVPTDLCVACEMCLL